VKRAHSPRARTGQVRLAGDWRLALGGATVAAAAAR